MVQLSPKDRVLLHLFDLPREVRHSVPEEATQEGIATALGIPRTHITRLLRPLVQEGLIEEEKERVLGKERRLKVYSLSPKGLSRAESIVREASSSSVEVIDAEGQRVRKVEELLESRLDLPVLKIIDSIGKSLHLVAEPGRYVNSNAPLEMPPFFDREEELRISSEFLGSKASALVVFANYGYGSSTFLKKFALEQSRSPLFWHDLQRGKALGDVRSRIADFCRAQGCEDGDMLGLRERDVLLCFDNYHDVSEDVVDLFFELMNALQGGRGKMAVAIREETPFYNRFFQKSDVGQGRVAEIHLRRFDHEAARRFMGEDLEEEAFQLIYRLTRGQPLALELVRKGDEKGLQTLLPNEEVRFLMYLRTKKRGR